LQASSGDEGALGTRPEAPESLLTLDDLVAYALANNPMLMAYADEEKAARYVPPQKRALPDPMLSFGYFARNVETRVGPQEDSWMITQKFPFFGKLSLAGQVAEKEAEIARRNYQAKTLDLVEQVKAAYFDYYRVYQVTRVVEEERDVLRHMQEVAQVKYASGQASQQDVLKAQLALSRVEDELTRLRRRMVTAETRLNRLLNRAPLAPLPEPRAELPRIDLGEVESYFRLARERRPELSLARAAVEKADRARRLARRQYFPDLTLSFQYVRVGERPLATLPENGKDAAFLKASINLPLWFGKLSAGVKEADAKLAMARHRREAVETAISTEVRDAYERVEAARDLVDLYERVIIPQAEQTFRASEAGYQTGEVDFLDYLDSERMLLAVRKAYYNVVADLGKETAYFERTLGVPLKELVR